MANNQWYEGNDPDSENYELIGEIDGFNIWSRCGNQDVWINIKMTSIKKRLAKANYWISYNIREGRFRKGRDLTALDGHHNETFSKLENFLLENR